MSNTPTTFKQFLEKVNPDYVRGLNRSEEKAMRREIDRFKKMDSSDPAAYPKDWPADQQYKKRKGKVLPKSKHTDKYHQMYGEDLETVLEGNVDVALKNKAEKTGISMRTLRAVFNRGMAAWRTGHRPGVAQVQWAMGRVNSFITGGKAREVDHDLWVKRKG